MILLLIEEHVLKVVEPRVLSDNHSFWNHIEFQAVVIRGNHIAIFSFSPFHIERDEIYYHSLHICTKWKPSSQMETFLGIMLLLCGPSKFVHCTVFLLSGSLILVRYICQLSTWSFPPPYLFRTKTSNSFPTSILLCTKFNVVML